MSSQPTLIEDWLFYLKVKQFVPQYLQAAFLFKSNVLTIYDLESAFEYFKFPLFTYDELEKAKKLQMSIYGLNPNPSTYV